MDFINKLCKAVEGCEWRGNYSGEGEIFTELKQCLQQFCGSLDLGVPCNIYFENLDNGKIKPILAFGAECWPDGVVEIPGILNAAIEVKLRTRTTMPAADVLGQCMMYRAGYDWAIGVIVDEGPRPAAKQFRGDEDALKARLWEANQIRVITVQPKVRQ